MTNAFEEPIGVQPGDVLAGKYRVERVLGVGGMGVVVAAHHLQLDEKVALKFLLPAALRIPEAVARFVSEARAAVKIKSEHVARVIDVGQLEDGAPYMVMEYLDGSDLASWLRERGAMPVEQAVDFVLQACEALAEAHALGIVHRDLKPANLFCILRADGQLSVKVLDFGISKVTTPGAMGHDMTSTAAIVGSPMYMSPEQLQSSKGVDARTDIWSLGIILFELLTARAPFEAEAVTELVIKIATVPSPPLRSLRANVPPALEAAVGTCLEKDRTRRFQTVGDLAMALQDLGSPAARASVERVLGTLRKAGLSAAVLLPSGSFRAGATSDPAVLVPGTLATWQTGAGTKKSRGLAIGLATAAILVMVGVGSLLLLRRDPKTTAPTGTAAAIVPPPASAPAAALPSSAPAQLPPLTTAVATASAPAASAPATASAPVASSPAKPAALPRLTGNAPPGALPKGASCDPPYYINDKGSRIFRTECL